MKRLPAIAWFTAMAALLLPAPAGAQNRATYEKKVADHARANHVPEALVHRVIVRESKYHPDLIGHGGTIGLMQIKLPTARGLGYQGDAEGLRDPDTNLTYGVKYLAGAYRAAEGDHDRAVRLYASGYYEVAKRQRLERSRQPEPVLASAPPQPPVQAKQAAVEPKPAVVEPKETAVEASVEATAPMEAAVPVEAEKPEETEKPQEAVKPREAVAGHKIPHTSTHAKPKPLAGPLILTPLFARLKAALTPSPKTPPTRAPPSALTSSLASLTPTSPTPITTPPNSSPTTYKFATSPACPHSSASSPTASPNG